MPDRIKNYRLVYDQNFYMLPSVESEYGYITGLTLWIEFELIDEDTKKELFFKKDKKITFPNVVKCSFDRNSKEKIKIEPKQELLKMFGCILKSYNIDSYCMCVDKEIDGCFSEMVEISKEEFYQILNENLDNLDNLDNKWVESTAYGLNEVE